MMVPPRTGSWTHWVPCPVLGAQRFSLGAQADALRNGGLGVCRRRFSARTGGHFGKCFWGTRGGFAGTSETTGRVSPVKRVAKGLNKRIGVNRENTKKVGGQSWA